MRENRIVFIVFIALLVGGCATGRGKLVSDIGNGAAEYRNIAGQIGEGQAELGITGARIEERSRELEQSIIRGAETIQGVREIIQRVRKRPIEPDCYEEWRNSRLEAGSIGEDDKGDES